MENPNYNYALWFVLYNKNLGGYWDITQGQQQCAYIYFHLFYTLYSYSCVSVIFRTIEYR